MTARVQQRPSDRHVETNRRAWDFLASEGSSASIPWEESSTPAEGRVWLDEFGWLPWEELQTVLLLCGAGGQQAPTLAAMGLAVTVLDLSPEQLAIDQRVARERGLDIESVRGDACDPEVLAGRTFDLIYQPVSTCYLPDPRACYRNVARLLRPGGLYLSDHWNPAQIQLDTAAPWEDGSYRIAHPSGSSEGLHVTDPSLSGGPECVYFAHRLQDLLGGICDAGFVIERFAERGPSDAGAEPASSEHLGAYLAAFYEVLARRTDQPPGTRRTAVKWEPHGHRRTVPQHDTRSAAGPRPRRAPLRRPRDPQLGTRFAARGFVILRDVLNRERLLPELTAEATAQRDLASASEWSGYGLSDDGTYVSGGMSFESAPPGEALSELHQHGVLRELIADVTGNRRLQACGNVAYMYFREGSYIDVHTDVSECQLTVLTSVVNQAPELLAYPRLRGLGPQQLLGVARRNRGRPPGGALLEVPVGGLLVLDGRRLPHRRRQVLPGTSPFTVAALCFTESGIGTG